jgi:hypothetical protein
MTRVLVTLPMFRILSCSESWEQMVGDHRVRFCEQCQTSVHNWNQLNTQEQQELLAQTERPCVRVEHQTESGALRPASAQLSVKQQQAETLVAILEALRNKKMVQGES